jgi:UDP-N-acetylglucosamine--N-acetylmuramyl-(pentapeptide) pyrophosphoryl-undecaprenol N-acetylglucosamine transferase
MDDNRPHIVFSGGGTGGHLFPGLAVAARLTALRPGLRITFAGSGKPFEREQVVAAGFHYRPVRCSPLPRGIGGVWRFLADNVAGYRAAGRFLREAGADVVVGLGGYASVPVARAAVAQGVPLVLLEQNAIPGRATRWLARRAALVCTAFESCHAQLPWRCQVRLTGNPVRAAAAPPRRTDCPRLLVLGGSNGSRALNESLPAALAAVGWQLDGWNVLHQAGRADAEATRRRYRGLGVEAEVAEFLADVPGALADADLAVCRSGGTTLAELAAAGVPALLVPYPHAADDHQRRNAEVFAAAGACRVVDERDGPGSLGERMATVLEELLSDASGRRVMSRAMRRLSRPEAAATVADLVLGLLAVGERPGSLRAAA